MKNIITSIDNDKIKLYQKLMTSKKARSENNMFAVEGARITEDALDENLQIHAVFITDNAKMRYDYVSDKIYRQLPSNCIYEINDSIARKISDTKSPQGIFAIVKKLDKVFNTDKIINNGRYIILNNLQDPGNIGTIIRTADAVGIDGVIMTEDCCELYNSKLVRSTMGSMFRINCWDECNIDDVLNIFKDKGINTFAAVIDEDALSLTECDFLNGGAVVIGNEGSGLPKEISNKCNTKLTIKMQGNIDSLNAAMATGIIIWEMHK